MISQDHTWFGAVAINSSCTPLRPAFLNRHLGGQNTISCTGRPLRRADHLVSGPRTAACRRPVVPSRSMPDGPRRRYNVDRETSRAAHAGFTPTCLASSSAAFKSLSRRRAYPQQPRNFSLHVDDQVCLPELIIEPCVSPLQLAYLLIQRISSGLRPRFFDRAFSDPAPPCATSSGATSTGPLAAGVDPPRRTGPLLRCSRRTEPPP